MADHPTNPDIRLLDGFFYADDPHRGFAWMRENAPVYLDETAPFRMWGINLHEDVMALSKNPRVFCSAQNSRPDSPPIPSMINMDAPDHLRRRNLVNRGFTPRRVDDHEPFIREVCNDLVDRVAPLGRCDFVRDLAAPLPMIMIGELLGVEPEDRDTLLEWSDDLIKATTATASPEIQLKAAQAVGGYAEYNARVVADRRTNPRDDLMSILANSEIEGAKLAPEEIMHEGLLILVGGDETTRHVITGGMRALIENPAERQKLIDDPARLEVAVEEMLRWVTPIQNMNRTATCDVELRGQKILEGDKVLLLYPSANRDARVFPDPFRFDVERAPNDHVAFGGYGPHFCLGASLARLELRVMFETLLERLPDIELAADAPAPEALEMRPSNFIIGIESMPVEFTPGPARAA